MGRPLIFAILWCVCSSVYAAFEEKPSSARSSGLGDAFCALADDSHAVYYNPAGLDGLKKAELSSTYTELFSLSDLSYSLETFAFPSRRFGAVALSYNQFGPSIYREKEVIFSQAFSIAPQTALGYNLKYSSVKIKRYGSASSIGIDAGILGHVNRFFSLGVMARNLNHPRFSESPEGPSDSLRVGVAVNLLPGFITLLDLVKPTEDEISWHVGQEVNLIRPISLRFGIQSNPSRYSGGLGLGVKIFRLDYAFMSHPFLDFQHCITFTMEFGRDLTE